MFFVCLKLSNKDKWFEFIFFIGLGLSVADVTDRLVSGITTFQYIDKIIIIITGIIAFYKLIKRGNN